MTHGYVYITVCMYASVICSILQPAEQTKASTAPLVKHIPRGVFRKKPPANVWADTWHVTKVLNLLHVWGNPSVLNYTCLTLKTVMILALATVKMPSDLNLLRITLGVMQILENSGTFQPVFGFMKARQNHPYGPVIILRHAEDECLHPVRPIKEYLAKTKDREN